MPDGVAYALCMHTFNNHTWVLHNVTPIDLLVQSAVLWRTRHLGQTLACPTHITMLRF